MRKNRILIVEDESSLLKLETILLSVKGFEVTGVCTGSMALEKIEADEYDLILLDIMLPDIDGFEICSTLRANPRTAAIPIIMLTGRKTQEDHDRGVSCGADTYIVKPFKSAMVISEINRLLQNSETGR